MSWHTPAILALRGSPAQRQLGLCSETVLRKRKIKILKKEREVAGRGGTHL